MSEARLHEDFVERSVPLLFRLAPGMRVARTKSQRGTRSYVVRSRDGDICQLGEEEHFLLAMLDGRNSFDEIERGFRERFAGDLSTQHFQSFIDELLSAGVIGRIDDDAAAGKVEAVLRTSPPLPLVDADEIDAPPEEAPPEAAPPADAAAAQPASAPAPDAVPVGATITHLPSLERPRRRRRALAAPAEVAPVEPMPLPEPPPPAPAPVVRPIVSVAPLFLLLARAGSPLRYFIWLLVPAALVVGVEVVGREREMAAALTALDRVALGALAAAVAALVVPSLVRGAAAAFFGAPREALRLALTGAVLPRFRIDHRAIAGLPRRSRAWTYAAPLCARLGLFAIGGAVWLLAADPVSPPAIVGLVVCGVGWWSLLFSAAPLWPGDGRRWLAAYLDEPALDQPLWRALRAERAGDDDAPDNEIQGRGFLVVAAVIALAALAGALLLWGGISGDAVLRLLDAGSKAAVPWLGAAREAFSPWIDPGRTALLSASGGVDLAALWHGATGSVPHAQEIGTALLGAAALFLLLWLALARVSAGPLNAPVDWDEDGIGLRGPGGGAWPAGTPGALGRVPAGGPPSLDDRLVAGSLAWPANRKVIFIALLFALLVAIAFLPYPYESGGAFTVVPYDNFELDARVGGEVTEVLVREGEWVNQGDVVGVMSDWTEVYNLATAKAELEKATARLQDQLILPKPEQMAVARALVEQAQSRLPFSKAEYERDLALVQKDAISVKQFEQAQSNYEQDAAAVAVTKANYDLVRVGATPSEIEASRAAVRLAQAQVKYAEDQLDRTRIRATSSGRVITPDPQLLYGKFLTPGQTFVQIEDNRVAHVEVQVPETDIRDIHIGGRVRAKAWGYEHDTRLGKVVLIAPNAQSTQAYGNVVRVVAEIPNADGLLRPQMSGYAKVQTVDMPVWVSFTRALVRFLLIEFWSWIP